MPELTLRRRPLTLALLLVAISARPAPADDVPEWAGFRGPGVDGVARDAGALGDFARLGLKVAWKTRIGSGYSGIAIAGGRAITQYADGASDVIAAFDAESGEKLWSYPFAETYAGHDGSHDGPIATPLVAGGRVVGLGPRGQLFALDLETGRELWKTHLVDDHGAKKPHYGFGTSPIAAGGLVILELGGDGTAMAAFDPATGEKKWTAGSDAVGYQVPVPMTLGGRRQVVGAGETKLFGVDAESGELLWELEHGGGGAGAHAMTPVPAGDGRILLAHKDDASKLVAAARKNGELAFEDVWEARSIRNSYNVPVVVGGHVYAFSSRFLTCVDAATGESRWRSRAPGDGFLIAVGDQLVIATKKGGVHVVAATPEGYRELAGLPAFEDLAWTPPSFAGGSIYARSFGEIARLDFTAGALPGRVEVASRGVADSAFGRFLAEVDAAGDGDKAAVVDRFLAAQKSFPIVEGERVHFVYRGEASDVALAGDLIGARREQAMRRVPGTDLFYHTVEVAPGTRANYLFIKDFEEIVDPRNPRQAQSTVFAGEMELSRTGEGVPMSWLAVPPWTSPAHLEEAPEAVRGRLVSHELESETLAKQEPPPGAPPPDPEAEPPKVELQVYLPRGYDEGAARYPVAYVHNGSAAVEHGRIPNSLDHLIGDSVAPVIVAFVSIPAQGPAYDRVLTGEVIPFVDATYRTVAAPEGRASVGMYFSGVGALVSALQHPELFKKVAVQSALLLTFSEKLVYPLLEELGDDPPVVYLDWGTYDMRNPHENWDLAAANRKLAQAFRDQGVQIAGGELPEGTDWSSWRNRTDKLFAALFPLE